MLEGPDYRVKDEKWTERLESLRHFAEQGAQAAKHKDFEAFSLANDHINENCIACHYAFAPHLEAPPPAPH